MLKVFCYVTLPSLIFLASATLLSPTRIDGTASRGIFKGPVVPLGQNFHGAVLGLPVEIHIQSFKRRWIGLK
jgi:hypothetical protein